MHQRVRPGHGVLVHHVVGGVPMSDDTRIMLMLWLVFAAMILVTGCWTLLWWWA